MTVTLIWLIAFAVILFLALRAWDGSLGKVVKRRIPAALQLDGDDRWVWSIALAVLGATFIVNPISMLLTLIILALIYWVAKRVGCWLMRRVKLH
ncbi:hypothetical protein KZO85_04100 [Chromohalobacter canadensis]|uniref:hypothetical protein n=1 Tax=Chromohalobacter canadensis TaxID=141389 RepID=UPI0021C03A39|nr:hypothetical protein [Chromohalobacter canadensis]MCT8467756.1 hypothetical protein [Chromohalobacter canadensis]MCT8470496.1 hypothetical protein [Chromohalobacter canadensis]MCT8498253.1 hypothetical protein [Chromohalobacter canadensis]